MGASTCELHKTMYDDVTGWEPPTMQCVEMQVTIRIFQSANLTIPLLCDTMYMCMSAA